MRRNAILLSIILFLTTPLSAQEATKSDTTKTQKLKEVVVTHQKQLIKNDIDKLTYNVKDDVTAQTKSTLEVLKKVPFVTVDGQDNIKVQGSANFKVYKNGHPDPAFAGQSLKEILKASLLLPSRGLRLSPILVLSMMPKGRQLYSTS